MKKDMDVRFVKNIENNRGEMKWSKMALNLELIGPAAAEPDYYTWCISPVMDDDGKVHLFVARWPVSIGFGGWTSDLAEIAHYIGDRPEGPFRFQSVIVNNTDMAHADTTAAHNPRVKKFGDKYALIYHAARMDHGAPVNCVRLKIADSPMGPWKDAGENGEVVPPPPFDPKRPNSARYSSNPDILMANGKYYIYVSYGFAEPGDHTRLDRENGSRWRVFESEKLEGPYSLMDKPITNALSYTEDINVFACGGKYYILLDDNFGANTGIPGAGILIPSDNPYFFDVKDGEIGFGWLSDYCNELYTNILGCLYAKFERPAVLVINDKPAYFYAPSRGNISNKLHHETYVLKIRES